MKCWMQGAEMFEGLLCIIYDSVGEMLIIIKVSYDCTLQLIKN